MNVKITEEMLENALGKERIKKARNLPGWVKFIKLFMMFGLILGYFGIIFLLLEIFDGNSMIISLPIFFIWVPLYMYLFNWILWIIKPIRIKLNNFYGEKSFIENQNIMKICLYYGLLYIGPLILFLITISNYGFGNNKIFGVITIIGTIITSILWLKKIKDLYKKGTFNKIIIQKKLILLIAFIIVYIFGIWIWQTYYIINNHITGTIAKKLISCDETLKKEFGENIKIDYLKSKFYLAEYKGILGLIKIEHGLKLDNLDKELIKKESLAKYIIFLSGNKGKGYIFIEFVNKGKFMETIPTTKNKDWIIKNISLYEGMGKNEPFKINTKKCLGYTDLKSEIEKKEQIKELKTYQKKQDEKVHINNELLNMYKKLKDAVAKNPNDDSLRTELSILEGKIYQDFEMFENQINKIKNKKNIKICEDNKCINKININDFSKLKEYFLKDKRYFGNKNLVNFRYQIFLINLIDIYINNGSYRKAFYYHNQLLLEFEENININAYKNYIYLLKSLSSSGKIQKYKKFVNDFGKIFGNLIKGDIQLYTEEKKKTFYKVHYNSNYYVNQYGLFLEYLRNYKKAISTYKMGDINYILSLRNLCISKYLDTKSKTFVESDKIKYKNNFEESLNYCLKYEKKYEEQYLVDGIYKGISKYKGDYEILNYIGLNYWFLGKLDLAKQYYEKSLKNGGNKIKIYNNLGIVYEDKKDYKKAIEYYKKVLKLNENNYDTLVNISKLYGKLEDYENSINYMLRAIKIVNKKLDDINPYNQYLLCIWYDKKNVFGKQYCEGYIEISKIKKWRLDKKHVEEVLKILEKYNK